MFCFVQLEYFFKTLYNLQTGQLFLYESNLYKLKFVLFCIIIYINNSLISIDWDQTGFVWKSKVGTNTYSTKQHQQRLRKFFLNLNFHWSQDLEMLRNLSLIVIVLAVFLYFSASNFSSIFMIFDWMLNPWRKMKAIQPKNYWYNKSSRKPFQIISRQVFLLIHFF